MGLFPVPDTFNFLKLVKPVIRRRRRRISARESSAWAMRSLNSLAAIFLMDELSRSLEGREDGKNRFVDSGVSNDGEGKSELVRAETRRVATVGVYANWTSRHCWIR